MTKADMVKNLESLSEKNHKRPIHIKDRKKGDWHYPIVIDAVKALKAQLPQPGLPLTSGGQIPMIGLGTWGGGDQPEAVAAAVQLALQQGYRSFDLAECYGNEKEIGVEFVKFIAEGNCLREDLFITSKVWNTNHEPEKVKEACKNTLTNFGLDYLDLYLVHWPLAWEYIGPAPFSGANHKADKDGNPTMAKVGLHQTWAAMEQLVDEKLVRHIGVSNYNSLLLGDLLSYCRIPPAVNQVECHPYLQQRNLLAFMRKHKVILEAYAPLGRPGQHGDGPELLKDAVVVGIAERRGVPPATILLGWALQRHTVPLPKSSNQDRLLQNLEIPGNLHLTREEMEQLNGLERAHHFCNYMWNHGHGLYD